MFVYQVSVILAFVGVIFVPGSRSKDIARNDDGLYFDNVKGQREDLQELELNSGQDVRESLFKQYLQDQMNAVYRKSESIRQAYERLKDFFPIGLHGSFIKHDHSRGKAWQRHQLADNFESKMIGSPDLHKDMKYHKRYNFGKSADPAQGLHKDARKNQIILEREQTFNKGEMFDYVTGPPGLHKDMKNSRSDIGIGHNSRYYEDFKDARKTTTPRPPGPPGLHKDMKNSHYYEDFEVVNPTFPGLHKK